MQYVAKESKFECIVGNMNAFASAKWLEQNNKKTNINEIYSDSLLNKWP